MGLRPVVEEQSSRGTFFVNTHIFETDILMDQGNLEGRLQGRAAYPCHELAMEVSASENQSPPWLNRSKLNVRLFEGQLGC